jgi:hypothetical protein
VPGLGAYLDHRPGWILGFTRASARDVALWGSGATVRIHTGRGTTRAGHLYLGSGRPIWNNDGDTASLIDPLNIAVSRYRY